MSDSRAVLDAVEALSKACLAFADEMSQSRVIQQEMAGTLVKIHSDNQAIIQRMDVVVERSKDVERRQRDSEGRIKLQIAKLDDRVTSVEAAVKIRLA